MLSGKRVRTRQALDLAVAMFYRIIKTFLGDAWQPQEVCFMHNAPEHPEFHRRFFGTRCDLVGITMESSAEPPISRNQYLLPTQ
jgi:hypothetical protein